MYTQEKKTSKTWANVSKDIHTIFCDNETSFKIKPDHKDFMNAKTKDTHTYVLCIICVCKYNQQCIFWQKNTVEFLVAKFISMV